MLLNVIRILDYVIKKDNLSVWIFFQIFVCKRKSFQSFQQFLRKIS